MHDETVETYTNVYARWFAIISQFIVTASLCTLWRLQMTRYSQVLVHSTVVNSRLSHQYMSISPFLWGFTAGFLELFLGFLQFQLLFARSFPAFWLGLGAVLVISVVHASFSYSDAIVSDTVSISHSSDSEKTWSVTLPNKFIWGFWHNGGSLTP